jgi:hypothetical protein
MSAMKLEGYRQVRQQRLFVEQQQLELLENDKIQSEFANAMRVQRLHYDKENRREMAAMKIDTLKGARLMAQSIEAEAEKATLANNRIQQENAAHGRSQRASHDADLRREMSAMRMEAYRAKQADRRAKEKAAMGRLHGVDPMSPDDAVGANTGAGYTLNQLLSSAGLKDYLSMLDSKGCRTCEDLGMLSPAEVKVMVSCPPLLAQDRHYLICFHVGFSFPRCPLAVTVRALLFHLRCLPK